MNTHTITETIRRFLMETMPEVTIHTPISNGELSTPLCPVELCGR